MWYKATASEKMWGCESTALQTADEVFVVVKHSCHFDRKCVDILSKTLYISVTVGDRLVRAMCPWRDG